MRDREKLTQKQVRMMFDYEETTGHLYWRYKAGTACVGDKVGHLHKASGYMVCKINNFSYQMHHIVWIWCKGALPDGGINHIGDRSDTAIDNWYKVESSPKMIVAPKAKSEEVSFL